MKPWTLLLAMVALAALAVPALAADHNTKLSAAAAKFEWQGAPEITRGSPVWNPQVQQLRMATPCDSGPVRPCETLHIQLLEDGKLTLKAAGEEGTGGTTDMDLYLYASDAGGTQGELLVTGGAIGDDTITLPKGKAGFYLLVADYYSAYNSGYKGTATFVSAAPAVPPPAPPAVTPPPGGPAQPAAKKPSRRVACQKKAKKIKKAKKRKAALKRCKKIKS